MARRAQARTTIEAAALGLAVLVLCAALSAAARAYTSASIRSLLSPNRLGARAALTFSVGYSGGELGVPSPVRRSVVKFPAGLSVDIPRLRSCSAQSLRSRGPGGCPPHSQIGAGQALAEVHAGSQLIAEHFTMWVFLGPLVDGEPTVEVLGHGYTPFDERLVLTGSVLPGSAPYGEEMVMPIPPIPTLPFEPDASIVSYSLTIGPKRRVTQGANTVLVPSRCPTGGFPFAAEFTYADGSSADVHTTAPCPR